MPEANRFCVQAGRDRAYKQHLDALKRTKASVDTSTPDIPKTIGRDLKRFEIEKQKMIQIENENNTLARDLQKINDRKTELTDPQCHFTLHGKVQKEQAYRIELDNKKMVNALHESKPTMSRNDWFYHECDHEYQTTRKSHYKKTVPFCQVLRKKLPPMEPQSARVKSTKIIEEAAKSDLFVTEADNQTKIPEEPVPSDEE